MEGCIEIMNKIAPEQHLQIKDEPAFQTSIIKFTADLMEIGGEV